MKYMGSKSRIAKFILPIILHNRVENQYYIEPFAGGMNIIDKVVGYRIASDKNVYLIEMWKLLVTGYTFPIITKELYNAARMEFNNKTNVEFTDAEIGWIGWMGSFNGRFFDGGYSGKTETRDYIDEQIRNTEKQIPNLLNVEFKSGNYNEITIPNDSIIYCDIPYKGTKQYSTSKNFDYDEFWEWCRDMSKKGHKVFISEYSAPDDFKCVWEMEVTNSMSTANTYKPMERLFIHTSQKEKIHKFFEL